MPLLPLKTNVNSAQSLYAPAGSGGGGGGGGPNLVCSSIVINDGVMTTNSSASGFVFQNSTTPVIQDAFLQASSNLPMAAGPGTANIFQLNSASGSANTITLGAGNDNASYIWTGGGGTQDGSQALYIKAAGVYMSSLTVSSINGAVPGGGGGSSGGIAVSSITSFPGQTSPGPSTILIAPGPGGNLALTGYPATANAFGDIILDTLISANALATNFQPGGTANAVLIKPTSNVGTQLNVAGTDAGGTLVAAVNLSGAPSSLTVASDSVNFLQPTAAGTPLSIKASDTNLYDIGVPGIATASIGTIGGRNQFYTDRGEVDDCMVSTITAVAGANITALKPLAVSSIVGVSTINGAAYPPAAGPGITRTTVNTNGSGDILGDGTLTPITAGFTTTAGHLYSLEGFVYAAGSPNISSNASLEFEIGNIDRAYQGAFPMWGYSGAGGLVFGNNLPVSLTWRANTGAVNNLLQAKMSDPLGTAVSTTINASNGLMLVDYGFVA